MDYLNKLDEDMNSQQESPSAGSFHNKGNQEDDNFDPNRSYQDFRKMPNYSQQGGSSGKKPNGPKAILIVLSIMVGIFVGFIFVMGFFVLRPQVEKKVNQQLQEDIGDRSSELNILGEDTQSKLEEIQGLINAYYLDNPDDKKVEDAIYKGLVKGLEDPYSEYFTKDEVKQWNESTSGSYSGIGAVLQNDVKTTLPEIVRVFEGSPAQEAGIKKGDKIYKVEDKDLSGIDLQLAVTLVKGEEGTVVNLTILREGEREPLEIQVKRRKIEVPTVVSKMIDSEKKVGYIQITQFESLTANQFREALDTLKSDGAESLIVDLRYNPGGLLDSVVEILDNFFDPGQLLVYMEDKNGKRNDFISETEAVWDKDVVVLVNKNSASASEIFAGAMKDTQRGTLVGETTFGKGVVQRFIDLPDGSAVKLTIASYFTPSGFNLHGKGVEVEHKIDTSEINDLVPMDSMEDEYIKTALEILKK